MLFRSLLAIWTIVFAFVVKSSPEQAGLTVEWEKQGQVIERVTLRDYVTVLKNPIINMICFVAICSQFVRWGLVNWIIKILTESEELGGFGLTLVAAAAIASSMHWGGAFFSIGMGYISDKVFDGKRWQTIFMGFLISSVSLTFIFVAGNSILKMNSGIFIITILL